MSNGQEPAAQFGGYPPNNAADSGAANADHAAPPAYATPTQPFSPPRFAGQRPSLYHGGRDYGIEAALNHEAVYTMPQPSMMPRYMGEGVYNQGYPMTPWMAGTGQGYPYYYPQDPSAMYGSRAAQQMRYPVHDHVFSAQAAAHSTTAARPASQTNPPPSHTPGSPPRAFAQSTNMLPPPQNTNMGPPGGSTMWNPYPYMPYDAGYTMHPYAYAEPTANMGPNYAMTEYEMQKKKEKAERRREQDKARRIANKVKAPTATPVPPPPAAPTKTTTSNLSPAGADPRSVVPARTRPAGQVAPRVAPPQLLTHDEEAEKENNGLQARLLAASNANLATVMAEVNAQHILLPASNPLLELELCLLCGSRGCPPDEMIYCTDCGDAFHAFCFEPPVHLTREQLRSWRCHHCKLCTKCEEPVADDLLLVCDTCEQGFHTYCLDPPLKAVPEGEVWICPGCVVCKSCGARTPGRHKKSVWKYDYSLCQKCGDLFDKKNFCPVCERVYDDDDFDNPMVCCDECDVWVHIQCDQIDRATYEVLSEDPRARYSCPVCRGSGVARYPLPSANSAPIPKPPKRKPPPRAVSTESESEDDEDEDSPRRVPATHAHAQPRAAVAAPATAPVASGSVSPVRKVNEAVDRSQCTCRPGRGGRFTRCDWCLAHGAANAASPKRQLLSSTASQPPPPTTTHPAPPLVAPHPTPPLTRPPPLVNPVGMPARRPVAEAPSGLLETTHVQRRPVAPPPSIERDILDAPSDDQTAISALLSLVTRAPSVIGSPARPRPVAHNDLGSQLAAPVRDAPTSTATGAGEGDDEVSAAASGDEEEPPSRLSRESDGVVRAKARKRSAKRKSTTEDDEGSSASEEGDHTPKPSAKRVADDETQAGASPARRHRNDLVTVLEAAQLGIMSQARRRRPSPPPPPVPSPMDATPTVRPRGRPPKPETVAKRQEQARATAKSASAAFSAVIGDFGEMMDETGTDASPAVTANERLPSGDVSDAEDVKVAPRYAVIKASNGQASNGNKAHHDESPIDRRRSSRVAKVEEPLLVYEKKKRGSKGARATSPSHSDPREPATPSREAPSAVSAAMLTPTQKTRAYAVGIDASPMMPAVSVPVNVAVSPRMEHENSASPAMTPTPPARPVLPPAVVMAPPPASPTRATVKLPGMTTTATTTPPPPPPAAKAAAKTSARGQPPKASLEAAVALNSLGMVSPAPTPMDTTPVAVNNAASASTTDPALAPMAVSPPAPVILPARGRYRGPSIFEDSVASATSNVPQQVTPGDPRRSYRARKVSALLQEANETEEDARAGSKRRRGDEGTPEVVEGDAAGPGRPLKRARRDSAGAAGEIEWPAPEEDVVPIISGKRERAPVESGVLATALTCEDTRKCGFCHRERDLPDAGRLLPAGNDMWVHINCALWSSEVYEDQNGVLINVMKALNRGRNMICGVCKQSGATVGCNTGACKLSYHVECAVQGRCQLRLDSKTLAHKLFCKIHSADKHAKASLQDEMYAVRRRISVNPVEIAGETRALDAMVPFRVGALTITSLGRIVEDQLAFHTPDLLFPAGFASARMFWSTTQVDRRCVYRCQILQRSNLTTPTFSIASDEMETIYATTPMDAWLEVFRRVNEVRTEANKTLPPAQWYCHIMSKHSGARLFGHALPGVLRLLELLPGTTRCKHYEFQFHDLVKEAPFLPLNPHGAARAEPHGRRQPVAKSRMARSKFLQRVTGGSTHDGGRGSEDFVVDLPVAMKYRQMQISGPKLRVGRSRIAGLGLFTTSAVEKDTMVIEYIGELIRSNVGDLREKYYDSKNVGCYMFRLDDDYIVDATKRGNQARFINHSCEPNCYTRIIMVEGLRKIVILTRTALPKDAELTYDYKFPIEDAKIPCRCGAVRCLGTMN